MARKLIEPGVAQHALAKGCNYTLTLWSRLTRLSQFGTAGAG